MSWIAPLIPLEGIRGFWAIEANLLAGIPARGRVSQRVLNSDYFNGLLLTARLAQWCNSSMYFPGALGQGGFVPHIGHFSGREILRWYVLNLPNNDPLAVLLGRCKIPRFSQDSVLYFGS